MKISDLKDKDIKVGIRVRSILDHDKIGTIVQVKYPPEDRFQSAVIQWDGGDEKDRSSFFENQCDCEIVEEDKGKTTSKGKFLKVLSDDSLTTAFRNQMDTLSRMEEDIKNQQVGSRSEWLLRESNKIQNYQLEIMFEMVERLTKWSKDLM